MLCTFVSTKILSLHFLLMEYSLHILFWTYLKCVCLFYFLITVIHFCITYFSTIIVYKTVIVSKLFSTEIFTDFVLDIQHTRILQNYDDHSCINSGRCGYPYNNRLTHFVAVVMRLRRRGGVTSHSARVECTALTASVVTIIVVLAMLCCYYSGQYYIILFDPIPISNSV